MAIGETFVRRVLPPRMGGVLLALSVGLLVGCSSGPEQAPAPTKTETVAQALVSPYITANTRVCSAAPGDKCAVTLEWNTGSTQPKSRVFRRANGGSWTAIVCVTGPQGSITVNDLIVGTTYDFAVRAVNFSCAGNTNLAQTTVRVSDSMVTRQKTELRYQGKSFREIGMMKLDLFHQFLGIADAPVAQAYDALDKAAANGVQVMTVLGAPWWPADLAIWKNNPQQYWTAFDNMLAAASAKGIKIAPVIWPNAFLFSDYAGQPLSDTFATSAPPAPAVWSRALLLEYATNLAARYANDARVLYWNLAFQLNLRADTDHALWPSYQVNVAKGTRASRGAADNFTTNQMIALTNELASVVRAQDPLHLISTGHGPPKRAAAGYRAQPEWNGGPAWPADTQAQMASYLADTHADPIDIVSIEVTNAPGFLEPYMPTNEVLGHSGAFNPDVIGTYQTAADALDKPLAISLFWDSNPPVSENPRGNFMRRAIIEQIERAVPISFINTWMSYQSVNGQLVPWPTSLEPTPGPSQMSDLINGYHLMAVWFRSMSGSRPTRLVLSNAGFESGTGIPDGWTKPSTSATAGQVDTSTAFEGAQSARLVSGSGLESGLIGVKGLDEVTLTAAISYPTSPPGTVTMQLVELDWASNPLPGSPYGVTLDLASGGGYRVEGIHAPLQAGTERVRVRFEVSGSAGLAVNVDDVRLMRLPATGEKCPLNGTFDTCTPQCPCKWGWGDCDSNEQCAAGLVCRANTGAAFGFESTVDVCVPAHCTNAVRDSSLGETGVDSGAPCGETLPAFASNVPKYGMGALPAASSSVAFAKQHSSMLFLPQPEVYLSTLDVSWPTPLIVFAGETKSYAQYRKLLAEGSPLEQQWLAGLDDYRRRAGRHPAFLYAELNSYRAPDVFGTLHRLTPPAPLGGAPFPARFQEDRRLLTSDCCQALSYAQCDANTSLCTPAQPLATYQEPETRKAVANLARFYVEHFEPQAFGPFGEINTFQGRMTGMGPAGIASGDEWHNGLLPTYAQVLAAVRSSYTERGLTPIPVFPSWQWDTMTALEGTAYEVTQAAATLMTEVYTAAPFDYIGISTYPAGWNSAGRFAPDNFAALANSPRFFTSVYDVFTPNGMQLPLMIAETSWPGRAAGVDTSVVEQNQRDYFAWLLGPQHNFAMVMSYLGTDARVSGPANAPCEVLELPMGVVMSPMYGIRQRPAIRLLDSHIYGTSRDSDGDGVLDASDNCPYVPNTNQQDRDVLEQGVWQGDGVGDLCDNCRNARNSTQFDANLDGFGNACDADFNGDGVANAADLDLLNARRLEVPACSSNPAYKNEEFDLNGDGLVDGEDVTYFHTCPSSLSGASGWPCAGSVPCPRVECAADPATPCFPQ